MNSQSLESSYQFCLNLAKTHYENFPVASLLIPKEKRKFTAAVYAFARIADDIADEGDLPPESKIAQLIRYKNLFTNRDNSSEFPHFPAVYDTISVNNLTEKNFTDLIDAFIQDNIKFTYKTFEEVLDYCKKSANPIGRILLEIFEIRNEEAHNCSDEICTALQLTNFYQDLDIDIRRKRYYIPEEILKKFELSYSDLENFQESKEVNENFRWMMKYLIDINNQLFTKGEKLLKFLNGLFKFEIKLTICGGRAILKKLKEINYNPFICRPVLKKFDWFKLILKALI